MLRPTTGSIWSGHRPIRIGVRGTVAFESSSLSSLWSGLADIVIGFCLAGWAGLRERGRDGRRRRAVLAIDQGMTLTVGG
jgi:hypothetical protein